MAAANSGAVHSMECMEIWGHNGVADQEAATPGVEVLVHSRPYAAAERGGDIHYVTLCASGKLTRTILADVAGHGSAVEAVAGQLRDILRKNINIINQKKLVRDLNNEFAGMEGRSGSASQFATAVVATVVTRRNQLTLCNAGHPRPLFYSARAKGWRVLVPERETEGDLPWGIAREVPYSQFAVPFLPGDVLMMYTDGMLEACGADGEQLGELGLLKMAEGVPVGGLKEMAAGFVERFGVHCGGEAVGDDLTMLFLRHTGDVSRAYVIPRRLRSYAKLLGLIPV